MLLLFLSKVSGVSRVIILATAASTMPACIIPLAPDFQDPPANENRPPRILQTNPQEGSIVAGRTFSLTVADPNDEKIFVRWIVDYPPFTDRTRPVGNPREILRKDGQPILESIQETINCTAQNLNGTIQNHQVMAAVSDRAFILDEDPEHNLLRVSGDTTVAIATWTLILPCPTVP